MTLEEKLEEYNQLEEESKAIRSLFKGRNSKAAMRFLERIGFWNKSTYVHGDPHGTSINEGNRQIVLKIKEIAKMSEMEIERFYENKRNNLKTRIGKENGRSTNTSIGINT
jgi:hypothetical protein